MNEEAQTGLQIADIYKSIYCERNHQKTRSYYTSLAKCCNCKWFPCNSLPKDIFNQLLASQHMQIGGGRFKARRVNMYLFLFQDGSIQKAYAGFDPTKPDWQALSSVVEVFFVSKTLVPQMKLVPKAVTPEKTKPAVPVIETPAPVVKRTRRPKNAVQQ